jgi:hypothetical protein
MLDYDDPSAGAHQRARVDFIQNELEFVQGCVKRSAIELEHQNVARAKELLDAAKRSHDTALDQLSKLPPKLDVRNLMAFAGFLAEDMRDLQAEIEMLLRQ